MEPRANLFGATVFWLYITAALTSSGLVIDTILKQNVPRKLNTATHRKHVALFCGLAVVSFTSLSFNMLHVLTLSYRLWIPQRFPAHSITSTLSSRNIRNWSIESTPFADFGNAIVEDEVRYLWVQSALLITFSICLYMSSEGSYILNIKRQAEN